MVRRSLLLLCTRNILVLFFLRVACGLMFSLAIPSQSAALSIFGTQDTFTLELEGPSSLSDQLDDELVAQRKNNLYLQQLSTPNRVARYESQMLQERLEAEGYYDAEVNFKLVDEKQIAYSVDAGEAYTIDEITYELPDGIMIPPGVVNLTTDSRLRAEEILAAENAMRSYVSRNFCLFEVDTSYEVVVGSETRTALVTLSLEDSPAVNFGDIRISGAQTIDRDYLHSLLPISEGDCFQRALVDTTRLKLVQSNLLTSVTADVAAPVVGEVDVHFHVQERFHRTFSAGGGFQTDDGFGVSAGWEHRNLFGHAEQLEIDATIAQRFQGLSAEYRIPQFLRGDQSVTFYADLIRQNTDAFESKSADVGAEVARKFGNHLRATLGAEIAFSRVQEDDETDDFALISLPLGLEYDRRNDPLNPERGWVAAAQLRPSWDGYDRSIQFLKSSLATSFYHTFEKSSLRPTLAFRAATGSIEGEPRDVIPANLRFYSGGGGSVRGYPFQTLGPLDAEDDPEGGLSFTELSFETRLRFGDNWGTVLFIDGGYSYEDRTPTLDEELLWGAGLGIRYYTSFAPIRFDIAVPLDKRDGIDDSFQIYISIGQSF